MFCFPWVWACMLSYPVVSTLCDPMDCSPPVFSVHSISQPRMLEWVQFLPPEALPHPDIESVSAVSPALSGGFFTTGPPGKPCIWIEQYLNITNSLSYFQMCVCIVCIFLFTCNYMMSYDVPLYDI